MWSHGSRAVTGRVPRYAASSTPWASRAAAQRDSSNSSSQPSKRAPARHACSTTAPMRRSPRASRPSIHDTPPWWYLSRSWRSRTAMRKSVCLRRISAWVSCAHHCSGVCGLGTCDDTLTVTSARPPMIGLPIASMRWPVSTMPRTSASSSVGSPIMKYSFTRCQPRANTLRVDSSMCASVMFLFTTSRMRWVPASGAKVSPVMRVWASSSRISSGSP